MTNRARVAESAVARKVKAWLAIPANLDRLRQVALESNQLAEELNAKTDPHRQKPSLLRPSPRSRILGSPRIQPFTE